jgi:hypothetical protein
MRHMRTCGKRFFSLYQTREHYPLGSYITHMGREYWRGSRGSACPTWV